MLLAIQTVLFSLLLSAVCGQDDFLVLKRFPRYEDLNLYTDRILREATAISTSNVDYNALISAIGLPPCVQKCVNTFATQLETTIKTSDLATDYKLVCTAYTNMSSCITADGNCDQAYGELYDAVTSGVANLCLQKKAIIDHFRPCLAKNLNNVTTTCDKKCGLMSTLAKVSHTELVQAYATMNGNGLGMLTQIAPLCSSLRCFLPCFRTNLNNVCSLAGGYLLSSVLKPFTIASQRLKVANPFLQAAVTGSLAPTCKVFVSQKALQNFQRGIAV